MLPCLFTSCENRDDGYVTIFHPVMSDARVAVPSHYKRFSIKMFTFTKDNEVLKDEVRQNEVSIGQSTWDNCVSPCIKKILSVDRFMSTVMQ